MRPWLTEALKPDAPTDEPTFATAGSAKIRSSASVCSLFIAAKEMSGEARVEAKINPVSSCGKYPFGVFR